MRGKRKEERSAIATEMQSLIPFQGDVLAPKEDGVIRIGLENINKLKPSLDAQEKRKKILHFLDKWELDVYALLEARVQWGLAKRGNKLGNFFEPENM